MRTIGHHQIIGLLGCGGMGKVFKVRHLRIGGVAALKRLQPNPLLVQLLGMAAIERRFLAEAKTMAGLRHPRLLAIWDFAEEKGVPYYLMEYFGHNLGQLIGETHRAEIPSRVVRMDKALRYMRQTLQGLARLHAAGIIHRDIKPFNIMITDDDTIKIGDFGTSTLRGESLPSPANLKVGSPYYAAPEQESAPDAVDFSADTYSAAVMLYRMLNGELPDPDRDAAQMRNPDLTDGWPAFFRQALATDPRQRFGSVLSMLAAIEVLAEDWRSRQERACRLAPATADRLQVSARAEAGFPLRSWPRKVAWRTAREAFGLDSLWRPLRYAAARFACDRYDHCVRDEDGGFLWQRSGAPFALSWRQSRDYIAQLNSEAFAGRCDWRLPTVPELMRLLQAPPDLDDFCATPLFDTRQRWLWSADRCTFTTAWTLDLALGFIGRQEMDAHLQVKAVAALP